MAGNREARMGSLTTFWTNASYKSFGRPHLLEGDADDAGLESGFPRSSLHTRASSIHTRASSIGESGHSSLFKSKSDKRTPSAKYTLRQLLYIFGSHGIGAMVISGVINFVIAYGKWTHSLITYRRVGRHGHSSLRVQVVEEVEVEQGQG